MHYKSLQETIFEVYNQIVCKPDPNSKSQMATRDSYFLTSTFDCTHKQKVCEFSSVLRGFSLKSPMKHRSSVSDQSNWSCHIHLRWNFILIRRFYKHNWILPRRSHTKERKMDQILSPRKRNKPNNDPLTCPVCGITLRAQEIEQHFVMEMDKLQKLSTGRSRKSLSQSPPAASTTMGSSSSALRSLNGESSTSATTSTSFEESWGTYQKIKSNRQNRLKVSGFTYRKEVPHTYSWSIADQA